MMIENFMKILGYIISHSLITRKTINNFHHINPIRLVADLVSNNDKLV
jgi:hypothetical protein